MQKLKQSLLFLPTLIIAILVIFFSSAKAHAADISITSPSASSTIYETTFNVTGTATANSTITVKINGTSVGSTTSDSSGDWSLLVSGQSIGVKTIEATAKFQELYTNVINVSSPSTSYMAKINTTTDSQTGSFSISSGEFPFFVWKPNSTFTQAYGVSPFLNLPTIWDINLNSETYSTFDMAGVSPRAASIAFNTDNSKVYVADNENAIIHVYNTSNNVEIGTGISVGTVGVTHPHGTIHRPNSSEIWEVGTGDSTVIVVDTASDTVLHTYSSVNSSPNVTAFSSDGSKFYYSTEEGITVMNADTGDIIKTIAYPEATSIFGMTLNKDNSKIYATNISGGTMQVYNLNTDEATALSVPTGPTGIALSADETKVYVTSSNLLGGLNGTSISVIDTSDNNILKTITTSGGPFLIYAKPQEVATTTSTFTVATAESSTLASTGSRYNWPIYSAILITLTGIAGLVSSYFAKK